MSNLTIGLDVGDQYSTMYVLDDRGECVETGRIRTTKEGLQRRFAAVPPSRVVLEAGTHSPWASRVLVALGHETIVANPRKLRAIYENDDKADHVDAEYLARVGRADPKLLKGIQHRSEETQADLAVVRARDTLVRTRTLLINHTRGVVKAMGGRLLKCSAMAFPRKVAAQLPPVLQPALGPVLEHLERVTQQVRAFDRQIAELSTAYPETAVLRQVPGVGVVTALAYVLVVGDPSRFRRSRAVGAYVGLRPRRGQSGERDPQLRITKAGHPLLRRLLVQAAHYILGPHGPDCDVRRHGERIAARGGKNARKRAVIAVARKVAVLLHHLWLTGDVYEPLRRPAEVSPAS